MPKAVVLTKYGPPDVRVWSDVPMLEPGDGQIRIESRPLASAPQIRRSDVGI